MAWGIAEWRAAADVAAGLAGMALAGLALAGGRQRTNRLLALLFFALGLSYLVAGPRGTEPVRAWPWLNYNLLLYSWTTSLLIGPLYLAFIGSALHATPLARVLRPAPVRWAILAASAAALLAALAFHERILDPSTMQPRPGYDEVPSVSTILAFAYGLLAAIDEYRRVRHDASAGPRARRYLVAFAVNDLGLLTYIPFEILADDHVLFDVTYFTSAATLVVASVLLLRALLLHQLFDLDLRIKWTIRRGTLVSAFLAVFVVVAAVAEQWLQQYGVLLGGVAVGLMLLALRPLERAAGRLADGAMPGVQDTPEYRLVRKREVYRAAVESAMEDGEVTDKERGVLATLAAQLGLDPREAYEIERHARDQGAPR